MTENNTRIQEYHKILCKISTKNFHWYIIFKVQKTKEKINKLKETRKTTTTATANTRKNRRMLNMYNYERKKPRI